MVTALLALSNKDADKGFAIYALYPAVAFWILDAYYLMQERLFRALCTQRPEAGREFDFATSPSAGGFFRAAVSISVVPLYGLSLAVALLIAVLS